MYILSYTTSNFHYSAAVIYVDDIHHSFKIIAYSALDDGQNNIANFIPFINNLLIQAEVSYRDITYVAMTTGPGSFTGIRTGLAFAHGLRLSTNVQVIGINSFQVTAVTASSDNADQSDILIVLESRRRDKYFQLYDTALNILKPAASLMPEEQDQYITDNVLIAGDGCEAILTTKNVRYSATKSFNAQDVGACASTIINAGMLNDYPLMPYYLHSLQTFKTIDKL